MAVANLTLFSHALGTPQAVNIILPPPEAMVGASVLYLLHGLLDDQNTWLQQTRLLAYAERYALVVVMPHAQRSFYTDQTQGYAWRRWIETELPAKVEQWLNLPQADERRHIAGLSMGGYGALKLALAQPERFKSAASFSGVLDIVGVRELADHDASVEHDLTLAVGDPNQLKGSAEDLFAQPLDGRLPDFFITCGLSDTLLAGNRHFRDHLHRANAAPHYQEMPGAHDWRLWDQNVADYLEWLENHGLLDRIDI